MEREKTASSSLSEDAGDCTIQRYIPNVCNQRGLRGQCPGPSSKNLLCHLMAFLFSYSRQTNVQISHMFPQPWKKLLSRRTA